MSEIVSYSSALFPGISALSCTGDFHFKDHIHSGYVIWLNSEGAEHFSLGRNSEILQPGAISIIEPGVVHSNHGCDGKKRHLRSLYLEKSFFSRIEELATGTVTGKLELPTLQLVDSWYWLQLLALHETILHDHDKMIQEQVALDLFTKLWDEVIGGRHLETRSNDSAHVLLPVIDYMHANLAEPIELVDLANLIQRTEYHIIRLFRKHIGMSPHAYLVQLRLEKARCLLEKKYPIADAALRAGFSDQSHLTRKFKVRYGVTPGGYLKSIRS